MPHNAFGCELFNEFSWETMVVLMHGLPVRNHKDIQNHGMVISVFAGKYHCLAHQLIGL